MAVCQAFTPDDQYHNLRWISVRPETFHSVIRGSSRQINISPERNPNKDGTDGKECTCIGEGIFQEDDRID